MSKAANAITRSVDIIYAGFEPIDARKAVLNYIEEVEYNLSVGNVVWQPATPTTVFTKDLTGTRKQVRYRVEFTNYDLSTGEYEINSITVIND